MSVQRLKIFKNVKGNDRYSKNPIIDSLIKQKLQSQMVIVKDNFNNLVQRQELKQKDINEANIKKRRLSSQNLISINTERIKESMNYRHNSNKEVIEFVIQRQKSSPFLDKAQIDTMNNARANLDDFLTKIKSSDKINYQLFGIKDDQIDQAYYEKLNNKIKSLLPSDAWLPSLPEVDNLMELKIEEYHNSPLKLSETLKGSFTYRPSSSSSSLNPLKSTKDKNKKRQKNELQKVQMQITYDPNKHHKNDYKSLQNWLQQSVNSLNRKYEKQKQNAVKQKIFPIKQHLNQIYSIYMCTLKQLIRLTYIQSAEKGLLLEKIVWSLVRLFSDLIGEQHKINYQEFKEFSKQINQTRSIYESRMTKLEQSLSQTQNSLNQFIQTKKKLSLGYLSYKKVNEEMTLEITSLMKEINNLKDQNSYLMGNLAKIITQFQQRDIIKIQKNEDYNAYYYLKKNNQIEVIAKVPRQQILQKYFQQQAREFATEHQIERQNKESNVNRLENQLKSYWDKKKNYLQIDNLVNNNFDLDIRDGEVQADRGPSQYTDHSTQYPQQDQQTFEQFLQRQLSQEKQMSTKKQSQMQQVTISLKQLYEQAHQSLSMLATQNLSLKQSNEQKDQELNYLKKKLDQLDQKVILYTKKINLLEKEVENGKSIQATLKIEIQHCNQKFKEQQKKHLFEKQNNTILALSIHQLNEKISVANKSFEQLQSKIKAVAPQIEQVMILADSSQNLTLLKLTALIEQNLSSYIQRDAKVFLTH